MTGCLATSCMGSICTSTTTRSLDPTKSQPRATEETSWRKGTSKHGFCSHGLSGKRSDTTGATHRLTALTTFSKMYGIEAECSVNSSSHELIEDVVRPSKNLDIAHTTFHCCDYEAILRCLSKASMKPVELGLHRCCTAMLELSSYPAAVVLGSLV